MKKGFKFLVLAIVLFAIFVLLDYISNTSVNLGVTAVQTLITVAIVVLFPLFDKKKKRNDE